MNIAEAKKALKKATATVEAFKKRSTKPPACPDSLEYNDCCSVKGGIHRGPSMEVLSEQFPDYAQALVSHEAERREGERVARIANRERVRLEEIIRKRV